MTNHIMTCANHPNRETSLRCNRCDKPICPQCAKHTPVGYRCRECLRGQQKAFDTARQIDYPLAAVISAIGAGVAMYLLGFLSWWGLFIAPVVGGGLADIIRSVVGRRRSRSLPTVAVVGGAIGTLPTFWQPFGRIVFVIAAGDIGSLGTVLLGVVMLFAVAGLTLTTLFYRLRAGIRV